MLITVLLLTWAIGLSSVILFCRAAARGDRILSQQVASQRAHTVLAVRPRAIVADDRGQMLGALMLHEEGLLDVAAGIGSDPGASVTPAPASKMAHAV